MVTWLLVARESPRDHSSISKRELHYIESTLETHTLRNKDIPWKIILTSMSVWITAVTMFCEGWGYYTLMSLLPKYYNGLLFFCTFSKYTISTSYRGIPLRSSENGSTCCITVHFVGVYDVDNRTGL